MTATPFLLWGEPEARLGWWMAGLAIDPFDSDFAAYTTGATIYATHDFSDVSQEVTSTWSPWVEGIEQTAVLTLTSPPQGPQLLSGFGDISGFAHDDLAVSPAIFSDPVFNNTDRLDFAGRAPSVVVRGGASHEGGPVLAVSEDFGRHWKPLVSPGAGGWTKDRLGRDGAIAVTADGEAILTLGRTPMLTRDRGGSWRPISGLPEGSRPVADRVEGRRLYAVDFDRALLVASGDGGASFELLPTTGLPGDLKADRPTWRETAWPLSATPGRVGDLWFLSRGRLYHSTDGGRRFARVETSLKVAALSFGKAPPGKAYPALFAIGARAGVSAIWRSDDVGKTWIRINDDGHQYGRRFRCISGDPRVFGRVYVGTDGRGVVYGEPEAST